MRGDRGRLRQVPNKIGLDVQPASRMVSVTLIHMKPRETLDAFDRYLDGRDLGLDAVVIGGTALNLLGVVSRPTKDCDILSPPLSEEVLDVGRRLRHGI